jgi:hypothetical protein
VKLLVKIVLSLTVGALCIGLALRKIDLHQTKAVLRDAAAVGRAALRAVDRSGAPLSRLALEVPASPSRRVACPSGG